MDSYWAVQYQWIYMNQKWWYMTVVIKQGAVLTSDSRGFVLMMQTQNSKLWVFNLYKLCHRVKPGRHHFEGWELISRQLDFRCGISKWQRQAKSFQVWESHGLVVEWRGEAGGGKEEHLGLQTLPPLQPMVTVCSSAWVVGGAGHLANSRGGRSVSFSSTSNCLSSWWQVKTFCTNAPSLLWLSHFNFKCKLWSKRLLCAKLTFTYCTLAL